MYTLAVLGLMLSATEPPWEVPTLDPDLIERPHARHYEPHRFSPPAHRALDAPRLLPLQQECTGGPSREVLGYLPYWELDYADFHWDKMTTLAFFGANMNAWGDLTNLHGWTGAISEALRDEAHEHGVRYILTIINFDSGSIDALVNDPARRAHAVDVMLDTVLTMGGDGVNIDFEGVPKSAKAGLVAFVQETTEAFHAAIPGSRVTVATPSIDWSGSFDYDLLAEGSDGLMIMAYGYHWSKGDPGPLSPPQSGEVWGKYNLRWTIEDYLTWGKPENHHKLILGLPFYGRDWPSDGPEYPGTALDESVYVPYADCEAKADAAGGFFWDPHSLSTYLIEETAGTWHQIWCDDGPSWAEKLALVEEYDLQGVGIWALGYERGTTGLWQSIADALVTDCAPVQPEPEPEPDPDPEPDPTPTPAPEPDPDPTPEPDQAPDPDPQPVEPDPVAEGSDGGVGAERTPEAPGRPHALNPTLSPATGSGGCSAAGGSGGWLVGLLLMFTVALLGRRWVRDP